MNINSGFEKPQEKEENKESLNDSFAQSEKAKDSIEKESTFEEDIATIEDRKQEVENLRDMLQSFKDYAFKLKEKMDGLELTEEKKQELYSKITDQSKEIASSVIEIKEEYGIEPTEIEVLSSRLANLTTKIEWLNDNLQLRKKGLVHDLEKYSVMLENNPDFSVRNVIISLETKHKKLPVSAEIIRVLSDKSSSDTSSVMETLDKYTQEINEDVEETSPYKTSGERGLAFERLQRLKGLADEVEYKLRKAEADPDSFRP
jgi:gas vesicle protein